MTDPLHPKRDLRRRLREIRKSLPPERADAMSAFACARFLAWPATAGARTIAVYAAHGGEIDPAALAGARAKEGAVICYPRVHPDAPLTFHAVPVASLRPGTIGISEPPDDAPAVPIQDIDLFVVPGVAFDPAGARLGQGVAYYDRTLPAARGLKVGFAYDFQIIPEVPTEAHDVRMDLVVTDRRVIVPGS